LVSSSEITAFRFERVAKAETRQEAKKESGEETP
jgi:hypothetical protein